MKHPQPYSRITYSFVSYSRAATAIENSSGKMALREHKNFQQLNNSTSNTNPVILNEKFMVSLIKLIVVIALPFLIEPDTSENVFPVQIQLRI